MSEQFLPHETTSQGARRIALAELEAAVGLLANTELDPNYAVHEARKKIKRLRALLRLLQKPLGDSVYRRENAALRDAARTLTSVREAAAALEALERLEQSHAGPASAESFARARAELDPHAPQERASVAQLLNHAAHELEQVRQRVERIELDGRGFELVQAGFRRSYRRARRALTEAGRHLTPEAFHELRKAVKAHQHQLNLLEAVWPELLKPRRHALSELAELLGEHHDLSLLIPDLRARGFGDVAAAAEERSAAVELFILQQARKLLAERPRDFAGTLGAWFANFQALPNRPTEQ